MEPGDVEITIARPAEIAASVLEAYDALLTDAERARKATFRFEEHRREYLVTRGLVRTTLSRHRPIEPAAWRFAENAWGCPRIDPPCGLAFNLSNHPSMVVCAVTEGEAVGIDVEPLDRAEQILPLAPEVFAPAERAALDHAENKGDRAVSLWTAKEAYIKARGMGLALPLDGFAFSFEDPRAPRITFAGAIEDDAERWWFRILDVDGYRIAVAALRTPGLEGPRIRVVT